LSSQANPSRNRPKILPATGSPIARLSRIPGCQQTPETRVIQSKPSRPTPTRAGPWPKPLHAARHRTIHFFRFVKEQPCSSCSEFLLHRDQDSSLARPTLDRTSPES